MTGNPTGATMRTSHMELGKMSKKVAEDFVRPEFYDSFAEFKGFEITQGQYFVSKTQYARDDQFVCMVDGGAHLRLVPHVNRQEMYTGEPHFAPNKQTGKLEQGSDSPNESPVNMFNPDFNRYPNLKFIQQKYSEYLAAGDCIYIPAFYFYQI